MYSKLLIVLITIILSSCSPTRNLVYFSDLKTDGNLLEEVKNRFDPEIQTDDLLSITVNSLNPESNMLFNNGEMPTIGGTSTITGGKPNEGYLVDGNGTINFPVLGKVKLAGLTKSQAIDKLVFEIKKSVKNPIVNIRFLNFRVTVVGEVNHPATFIVSSERINIIEAISLAGDLTAYGKRENVLIIREQNGIRSTTRVNLSSKSLLNSPYFYLLQNDIIYVEPVKARALQGSASSFYLPIISVAVSVLSILIFTLNR